MKHLTKFDTQSQYNEERSELDNLNVSYLEGPREVIFSDNDILKTKADAEVGDIAVYVQPDSTIKFISRENYQDEMGEPIGVVYCPLGVIPGDDNIRVLSLCNMSISTPRTGSLNSLKNNDNYMTGGHGWRDGNESEGIVEFSFEFPSTALNNAVVWGDETAYLPSNYVTPVGYEYRYDDQLGEERLVEFNYAKCGNSGLHYWYREEYAENLEAESGTPLIPNPYEEPEAYFQSGQPLSVKSGKENTRTLVEKVINKYNLTDLEGLDSSNLDFTDYDTTTSFDAASCCSLFRTPGTEMGDWYLPSIGELGILVAKLDDINKTLHYLEGKGKAIGLCDRNFNNGQYGEPSYCIPYEGANPVDIYHFGGSIISSTPYDVGGSRWYSIIPRYSQVEDDTQNIHTRVRASLEL